jgi:transketolase
VAHTIKGKGVSFMENDPEWHGKAPKPNEAVEAIREIVGEPVPAWAEPIIAELLSLEKK